MPADFPSSPTVGQVFGYQGAAYSWDGAKWDAVGGTVVPIGGIIIWGSSTLPDSYLLCDGSSYNITDAPLLFAKIGAAFGGDGVTTFAVPPLVDCTVVGAGYSWGLGASGGEINHTTTVAEMPAHAHGVADPTHAHSLADPGHTHGIGDPGHNHGFPDPGHIHGNVMQQGVGMYALGSPGGGLHNPGQTDNRGTGRTIQAAGTGIWTGGAGVGLGVYGAATGIGIYNAGGSGAHNNMQPFLALNHIIRFQ